MSGLPWRDLMRLGIGDLRLSPDVFWSMTPAELMLMAGDDPRMAGAQTREGLSQMMAMFPDKDDHEK